MRKSLPIILCVLLAAAFVAAQEDKKSSAGRTSAQGGKDKPAAVRPKADAVKKPAAGRPKTPEAKEEDEAALMLELDLFKDLGTAERVERLEAFVAAHPEGGKALVRASELLAGARAALGDERLRAGDRTGGVELFRKVVEGQTPETSDKLFVEVVSRLPANLYALGHREEALDLARRVEQRAAGDATRLLSVAGLYLSVELADDAARAAEEAARLAPETAAAHQALGAAHHQALRLDRAAEEFARALELDPNSAASRRSLADLRRATGRPVEALALYRRQLEAQPQDASARAGLVLSLFAAGRREEGEAELLKTLGDQPDNLPLFVGAAYHFTAEGDTARALDMAERAVRLEPRVRWVWARLAYARALLARRRLLEAEQAVLRARELGRFPTLDYELATALAAAGRYDEAAGELARTFALKDGQVETYLAGRTHARAADFIELLAPERRASLFQHKPADTAENARLLKGLLAFHLALGSGVSDPVDEKRAAEAALEFVAGADEMRAFRQLYVAGKLLERGAALAAVLERTEEAIGGVEAALDSPAAVEALLADDLRDARSRARAMGAAMSVPPVPRDLLSKIMRGRIEDLAGWALYKQGNSAEAVVRLKRAVSVLPENTIWWRASEWHLGAALEASGNQKDALAAYVKAYRLGPDPARRAVIESLYRRLNGTTDGLERLLDTPAEVASRPRPALTPSAAGVETKADAGAASDTAAAPSKDDATKPTADKTTPAPEVAPPATPEKREEPAPEKAEPTRTPETNPNPSEPSPTPAPLPTPTPAPPATPEESEQKSAAPQTPEPSPTPAATPDAPSTPARQSAGDSACALTVNETAVSLQASGGSAVVVVSLGGRGDPARISARTPNWADIIIFAEPLKSSDDAATMQRYSISSVSGKAGLFTVTFASPCGKRDVQVEVK